MIIIKIHYYSQSSTNYLLIVFCSLILNGRKLVQMIVNAKRWDILPSLGLHLCRDQETTDRDLSFTIRSTKTKKSKPL